MRHALATVPTFPGADTLGAHNPLVSVWGAVPGLREAAPNGECRVYDKEHRFLRIEPERTFNMRFVPRDSSHLPQE